MDTIILVGFMGCGKTTVSAALSQKLGEKFLDTDEEIAREAEMSVSEIFAAEGEAKFRDRETALLCRYAEDCPCRIVSTGGGMPLREENRKLLQKIGRVFYLQAQPETICSRLEHDTGRPLLAGLSSRDEKLRKIRDMLTQREEAYRTAAAHILPVDGKRPEEIASEILQYISY
ncbi:MAG: shikimate kinase [Lachnospiraceae bacterium]|nr:shikimate kinase [Lachnospiraceae bacterium]